MNTWIIPCNINYYDVVGAFNELNIVNWKQSTNIELGDIVFIYTTKPYSRITHKCKVLEVNLNRPYIEDINYIIDSSPYRNNGRYMTLKLIKTIDGADLDWLKKQGLKGSIQGPRKINFEI
jgi:5-methylcytosine-specific restriction enzyme A